MLGKPLEMASHLSLTTVIFSLLRRYYIRVTEISRSMTSTCCCCCCYTFVVAIPHAIARSRFVEIESNVIYSTLSAAYDHPAPSRASILRSFPIQRFARSNFIRTWTLVKKKKENLIGESLLHTLEKERKVSCIESNFENLKFKIEDFVLWKWFFLKTRNDAKSRMKILSKLSLFFH